MLVFILVDQIKNSFISKAVSASNHEKRSKKETVRNFFFFFFEFDISFISCDQKWGKTIKLAKTTKRYQ